MSPRVKIDERIPVIEQFVAAEGRAPTLTEICRLFGLKSRSSASFVARKLVALGVLQQTATGRLAAAPIPPQHRRLRLLGTIAAGFPSPAEEALLDTISLDEYLIRRPEATFMLQVEGDSMIEAGILPGDTVLIERGRVPRNGDIVIACVDGNWTMKYFYRDAKGVRLEPANKRYTTIFPHRDLTVEGVVSSVIRRLP